MKLKITLIVLLLISVTAGSALAAQTVFIPALTYAPVPTPTLAATPIAEPTLLLPTPTADPLPTREVERPNRSQSGEAKPRPSLLDQYMPEREVLAETEHFIVYAENDYFPVDLNWFTAEAEAVYDYVSERLDGAQVQNKIAFGFMPPDERTCPVRGLASHSDAPMVLVYADEESTTEFILAVLAHELGHAIPSEGFPGGLPNDLPLTEGLATWASGSYWAAYKQVESLDDIVRAHVAEGTYEPIRDNVEFSAIYPWHDDADEDCLDRRDQIYSQWGVFLGYLIETYGWEKAYDLFQAPEPVTAGSRIYQFPPDYEGIYGKSLNQLEFEWLNQL
jgi:hypothetical protein